MNRHPSLLMLATILVVSAGCDSSSEDSAPPPVPTADAKSRPPELTVEDIQARLRAANPDYDGSGQFQRAETTFREADLSNSGLSNLEPLRGLPLRVLGLRGLEQLTNLEPVGTMPLEVLWLNHSGVSDLTPLAGMRLGELNLYGTPVEDIGPLKLTSLGTLWLRDTRVSDLTPLAGKQLVSLDISNTPVSDIAPLAGMTSLERLNLAGSAVSDLAPLTGLRLQRIVFTPARITKGLDAIRNMPSLRQIGTRFDDDGDDLVTPREFWKQ